MGRNNSKEFSTFFLKLAKDYYIRNIGETEYDNLVALISYSGAFAECLVNAGMILFSNLQEGNSTA